MDATYTERDEGWEAYDAQPDGAQLPRRPHRQFFNKRSAALIAVITCAAGFYAGVRVEKSKVSSSGSGGSSLAAAIAAARGGASGSATGGASGSRGAAGASGAAGGIAALFARGGPGGRGTSFGTISSVRGDSLYVTTATGNVVKVKLSSATRVSKSLNVKRSALHPGDTVVIRGVTNAKGTVSASSVSDSGASARGGLGFGAAGGGDGSSGGASGAGASGAGAGSAVSSLFSSGGSGG